MLVNETLARSRASSHVGAFGSPNLIIGLSPVSSIIAPLGEGGWGGVGDGGVIIDGKAKPSMYTSCRLSVRCSPGSKTVT